MAYQRPPRHLPPLVDPEPLPADPLNATILQLSGWWLEARCGCGWMSQYPLRLLCGRLHPATPTIGEAARRLICEKCDARAATVDLVERAGGNPNVAPQPQRVPVPLIR